MRNYSSSRRGLYLYKNGENSAMMKFLSRPVPVPVQSITVGGQPNHKCIRWAKGAKPNMHGWCTVE